MTGECVGVTVVSQHTPLEPERYKLRYMETLYSQLPVNNGRSGTVHERKTCDGHGGLPRYCA